MEVDPLRQYMDAKAKFDHADSALTNLISFIGLVARAMDEDHLHFTVGNVKIKFPRETRGGYKLKANEWPTAEKIAETFAEFYNNRIEARNAWRRLSEDDRRNVAAPPETD